MEIHKQDALDYHRQGRRGKIEVTPTKPCQTQRDLSLAYTPGVAEPCLSIQANPDDAEVYVDGRLAGRAGKYESDPLELSSGTHKIEFLKAGYISETREIYVGNQSRHTLKVNLRKAP